MTKILIATDSLSSSSGGLGVASYRLCCETALALPDIHFLLVASSDINSDCITTSPTPPNVTIKILPALRFKQFVFSPFAFPLFLLYNPDILHLRGLWSSFTRAASFYYYLKRKSTLIVQPAGMLEPWSLRQNSFLKYLHYLLFEKYIFKNASCVHAASSLESDSIKQLNICPNSIVRVIPTGTDMPSDEVVSTLHLCRSTSSKSILFLSRLHRKKGIELLLDAFSHSKLTNWDCLIVGDGDPVYVSSLKSIASALPCSSRIKFLGHLNGLAKEHVFQAASVFVLPTYSENFGIVIPEAMSWKLPVITTTHTPWSFIDDHKLGWIVNPSASELLHALNRLTTLNDSDLAAMGESARVYAVNNFSWSHSAAYMKDVYLDFLVCQS